MATYRRYAHVLSPESIAITKQSISLLDHFAFIDKRVDLSFFLPVIFDVIPQASNQRHGKEPRPGCSHAW